MSDDATQPGQEQPPTPEAQRADPTMSIPDGATPPADATQSMAQSTPPTQALPTWTPPYPQAAPVEPPPVVAAPPVPPAPPAPVPYPYAGSELPAAAPPVPPPATYGTPPTAYGAPGAYPAPPSAYGTPPAYGTPAPYAGPPVQYAPPTPTNTSAVVLTIIAGIMTVSCYFTLNGIVPLVFGILALSKQGTDITASRNFSRIGWIIMAVLGALTVLGIIAVFGFALAGSSSY